MNEQEIRRLEGYDLKSITRADDCDCYDVETWKLAAVRKGDGGTNVIELTDRRTLDDYSSRAGEWEENVRAREKREAEDAQ